MMIANSACLVVTIRPFNQRHNVRRRRDRDSDQLDHVTDHVIVPRDVDDDEICEHLSTSSSAADRNHVTVARGNKTLPTIYSV